MQKLASVMALALVGCGMSGSDIEDGADDSFLAGGKSDAFGVEDWSPDGAAVLKLVSTATESELDDDVGLSARVAHNIVAKRADLGGAYEDLADLDAVSYVGSTAFKQLLQYVADHKLFKTAIRVPLLVDDGSGNTRMLSSYSELAHTVGKAGFAHYTFLDGSVDYGTKAASYDTRLQEVAAAAGVTIDGEMMRYGDSLADYSTGFDGPCYLGDPEEVADLSTGMYDDLLGDMYSVWGWKAGSKEWLDDSVDDADDFFGAAWTHWDTSTADVLIESTNNDDGDNPVDAVIPPCR